MPTIEELNAQVDRACARIVPSPPDGVKSLIGKRFGYLEVKDARIEGTMLHMSLIDHTPKEYLFVDLIIQNDQVFLPPQNGLP